MSGARVVLCIWTTVCTFLNFMILGIIADNAGMGCLDGGCLKCDTNDHCVKCSQLIVLGSRLCVDQCPTGYQEEWSSLVNYMGRLCRESGFVGLPGRTMAIVVGTFSGAAICLGVLVGGFVYLRSRRRHGDKPCSSRGHANSIHDLDLDTPDRREFLKHLNNLRDEAPVFLAMLNDTRKQVRASDSALQAYRPVLRDLVRILTLLNRSPEKILSPPGDWITLLAWGERVLRRYKKQHPHQVAQAQLVSFLQVPNQMEELAITQFNSNYQRSNEVPLWEFRAPNYTILAEWSASRDYLVDDDFITLGFRPQDEITTEL